MRTCTMMKSTPATEATKISTLERAPLRLKKWKEWKLSTKLMALAIVAILPILTANIFFLLPAMTAQLYTQKRASLQLASELAFSVLDEYAKRAETGQMDLATAQREALERLKNLRFGTDSYFVVTNRDLIMLMHPFRPEMVGKYSDTKDPNGVPISQLGVRGCIEHGQATVNYLWPKPHSTKPVRKTGLWRYFKPWGWAVTTGIYIDDVDAEAAQLKLNFGVTIGVAFVLALTAGLAGARKLSRPLLNMSKSAEHIADGDTTVVVDVDVKDEVGQVADALRAITAYQQEMAEAAEAIADGDLTHTIQPKSDRDALGHAFARMSAQLKNVIGEVATSAESVFATSNQLATSATLAGES